MVRIERKKCIPTDAHESKAVDIKEPKQMQVYSSETGYEVKTNFVQQWLNDNNLVIFYINS